jgi:hypothetical protein
MLNRILHLGSQNINSFKINTMPNYKFEVRLEIMNLTKSQVKEINAAIGAVVGRNLIAAGVTKTPLGEKIILNKEWLGKWLRQFATPLALKERQEYWGL